MKLLILLISLLFLGCSQSSKYTICNGNGNCSLAKDYTLENDCIKFTDQFNDYKIYCGSFSIYQKKINKGKIK